MDLVIRGGTLVTGDGAARADLRIRDGRVAEIGTDLEVRNCETVDATERLVFPGGVDVHTHMDLQAGANRAVDDFFSGTVAAACGGTTTIVDHVAFGPKGCPLRTQLDAYHGLADGAAVIDYGFHGVIQHVDEAVLDDMETLRDEGYASFKVYMTYDDHLDDEALFRVLRRAKELGLVIPVHAENHGVVTRLRHDLPLHGQAGPLDHARSRPALCEAEAVGRYLKLARLAGDAPAYIVHLTTAVGLREIDRARSDGQTNVVAETCTQYLTLTEACYTRPDGLKFVMSPPLRTDGDRDALWKGLAEGRIQVVATDHCPFNFTTKTEQGGADFTKCPNGAPGVEERFSVVYSEGVATGRLSLDRFVQAICTNPAKAMGLYPQKGTLQPGADADLVIFDPRPTRVLRAADLHSACDYSCYEGMTVQGAPVAVYSRGRLAAQNGRFVGHRGDGRFLRRHRFIPFD